MELKEFIKNVISDIEGARIDLTEEKGITITYQGVKSIEQGIEFDLMIMSEEGKKTKLGGGIKVVGMAKVSGDIEEQNKITNSNRIKFSMKIIR